MIKKSIRRLFGIGLKQEELLIFRKDLAFKLPQIETGLKIKVKLASAEDMGKLPLDVETDNCMLSKGLLLFGRMTKRKKIRRLRQGDLCFLAVWNNEVVGYGWVNFSALHIDEINMELKLGNDEACVYDCFVSCNHRGKRIYPKLLESVLAFLRDRGYKTAYIYTSPKNRASIRGIRRAGFVFIERVRAH